MTVYEATLSVLVPLVGKPATEICVRSSAVELGKTAEGLSVTDIDVLEANIRRSLSAFASGPLLDSAVVQIRSLTQLVRRAERVDPRCTLPPCDLDSTCSDVRAALRAELESRGYSVASDTLGARSELYVLGDNDLARALFEFKTDTDEAMDTMYQGSWTPGLPPRFAVLPFEAAEEPSFELLEQVRIIPLLWRPQQDRVEFVDLDALLAEHVA